MRRFATEAPRPDRIPELLLRTGAAACFIGHGAFGVMGKAAWLPYFGVLGIGEELAWRLMPVVGTFDILVGIGALLVPRPALLAYAAGWAAWTALLRPLAGESPFELLERAGNYGVPLALLVLSGLPRGSWRAWLRPQDPGRASVERRRAAALVLRATVVTLLLGHGALALSGKPVLVEHASAVGLPAAAVPFLGAVELGLAAGVGLGSQGGVLVAVLAWKLATEALYPVAGAPVWEFVERAGSYVAPLALLVLVRRPVPVLVRRSASAPTRAAAVAVVLTSGWTAGVGVTEGRAAPGLGAAAARADTTLLDALGAGGFVLACRHAITDRSRGDAREVDFSDPSTQRVLSEAGRAQARRLGRIFARLDVPVGEVLTSPYARTAESAELTFGRARVHEALHGRGESPTRTLRELLARVPEDGTNRVLMTHQGVLYRALPDVPRGSIREGDCMVIRPHGGDGFDVVARLGPDEWEGLAAASDDGSDARPPVASDAEPGGAPGSVSGTAGPDVVAAVRRGGTVLVCRHAITGSTREVEPVDYDDPSTQRLLSPEGEEQSREMGRAFRALGIEIPELVASPMRRAWRTAELMAGRPPVIDSIWHTNGADYGGEPRERRAAVLSTPVPRGNRLIVSHIGTMSCSVLPEARGRVEEGDCVVVEPDEAGHRTIGIVPWRRWIEAAASVRSGPDGGGPRRGWLKTGARRPKENACASATSPHMSEGRKQMISARRLIVRGPECAPMLAVFKAREAVKDPQGHVLFHAGEEIRWHADHWDQPIRVYREGRLARTFGPYHTPAIFVGLRQGALVRPAGASGREHGEQVTPIATRWEGDAYPSVM